MISLSKLEKGVGDYTQGPLRQRKINIHLLGECMDFNDEGRSLSWEKTSQL